ncbi:hypothetical protein BKA70DRAFT_1471827, partial [Coprinopsis sp. MPI-PUGE-AT-0042]
IYEYCEARGLREVWAYFWTNWYSPSRWKLWARSSSLLLSRLRTTMGVENFWRQLKHDFLHNNPRPRLDQLIWIIINKVTPNYFARLARQSKLYAPGRPKALTSFQKYLKRSWIALSKAKIRNATYSVDINSWTCNCGQQKYNPFHICKHLVQKVEGPLASRFWQELRRRRTTPLYIHPAIQPLRQSSNQPGSITDGDDESSSDENDHRSISSLPYAPAPTLKRPLDAAIDDSCPSDYSSRPSSPSLGISCHEEDYEDEVDEYIEHARKKAAVFRRAAQIFEEQAGERSRVWLSSVAKRDIGNDVESLVEDIDAFERTARTRGTTWAR